MSFPVEFSHATAVYPEQNRTTTQNGSYSQSNHQTDDLVYPRVEVEQRTHSGEEIAQYFQGDISKAAVSSI